MRKDFEKLLSSVWQIGHRITDLRQDFASRLESSELTLLPCMRSDAGRDAICRLRAILENESVLMEWSYEIACVFVEAQEHASFLYCSSIAQSGRAVRGFTIEDLN